MVISSKYINTAEIWVEFNSPWL